MNKLGAHELFVLFFRVTRRYFRSRMYMLFLLNILSIFLESMGLLLFIPFFQTLEIGAPHSGSVSRFMNRLVGWAGMDSLASVLVLLCAAFILKGLVFFAMAAYRNSLTSVVRSAMREELIKSCSRLDYRYAIGRSAGYFSNLVVAETDRAVGAMNAYCRCITALGTTAVFITAALVTHAQLSSVILCAGLVHILALRKVSRVTRRHSREISHLNSTLNGLLIELLHSFKYLKSTAQFDRLQGLIGTINRRTAKMEVRQHAAAAAYEAIREPVLVICVCSIIYYYVVLSGQSIAVILVPVLFFYRCMLEAGFAQANWQHVCDDSASVENVFYATEEFEAHSEGHIASLSESNNNSNGMGSVPSEYSIELKDIGFSYGHATVLKDFSAVIPKDFSVAFVGVSGAGKTTIVDLITGILQPQQGGVYVDGVQLNSLNLREYRKCIGYVSQETIVFSDTVANNICMNLGSTPSESVLQQIREIALLSNVDEFVRELPQGYLTPVGERGVCLSGGQRQRLAIARELFRKPRILILDESTSALDSRSEYLIQQSLRNLMGSLTLITISHRLATVSNVDRIYVVQDGKVVEQGTFSELLKVEGTQFRKMCELQRVV